MSGSRAGIAEIDVVLEAANRIRARRARSSVESHSPLQWNTLTESHKLPENQILINLVV